MISHFPTIEGCGIVTPLPRHRPALPPFLYDFPVRSDPFQDLIRVMKRLRGPGGCPWDRKQTHASLVRYLFEEAEELKQAIEKKDILNLEEELGDLLLQVVFHAQIAAEKKRFTINDIIRTLTQKLTLRHPHVFGYRTEHRLALRGKSLRTEKEVLANWAALKALSKAAMHKSVSKRRRRA